MIKKVGVFFVALSLLTLGGLQCGSGGQTRVPGGVHISLNKGQSWELFNRIKLDDGSEGSLARYDITDFKIDPNNPDIIYSATRQAGLYQSIDGGLNWSALTTKGQIQSVAINNLDSMQLAAAKQNQLFYTQDSGKIWILVYTEPAGQLLSSVAFDPKKKERIYISLLSGEVLRSDNSGQTWSLVHKFKQPALRLMPHSAEKNYVYALTQKPDIMLSKDAGQTWESITKTLEISRTSFVLADAKIHPKNKDFIMFASQTRIYLTRDGGLNWKELPLISAAQQELIQAIAFDPTSVNVIYYATPTVFYRSVDGGKSWSTNIFSSSKRPKNLLVHPTDSDKIFIATHS